MKRALMGRCLAVAFLATGCTEDGETGATPPSAADTLEIATNAFSSLRTAENNRLFGDAVAGSSLRADTDPYCNENGTPIEPISGDDVDRASEGFPSQLFYCVTTFNSYSPDTVQGALLVSRAILCAMDEALDDFAYDGEARTGSLDLTNSTCIPDELVEDDTDSIPFTATPSLVTDDSGWTHQIQFTSTEAEMDETWRFVLSERFAGFQNEGTLLLVDRDEGVARMETLFDEHARHLRVMVTGDIADNGTYSSIASLQGAWSQGSVGNSNHSVATIKGATADGYVGKAMSYNGTIFSTDASSCTGLADGEACTGAGIVFSDSSDLPFLLGTEGEVDSDVAAFEADSSPPCFTEVDSSRLPSTCDPISDL